MNVLEIIDLMSNIGGGTDNPPHDEKSIYLKYINLAYLEIFRKTLFINPYIKYPDYKFDCVDGSVQNLIDKPLSIRVVYTVNGNSKLKGLDVDKVLEQDPGLIEKSTDPYGWFYFNDEINIYPNYTGRIGIKYSKSPTPFNLYSEGSEILIPEIYHPVLANGACYYMFQDEGGFKDGVKLNEALSKWVKGVSDVCSFLRSLSGNSYYSTFSKV